MPGGRPGSRPRAAPVVARGAPQSGGRLPKTGGGLSKTGGELPLSPHHRVTATATYTLPLSDEIGRVAFAATYTHTSSQIGSDTSPFGILPESDLLNLNADWNSVLGSPVDLAFFVTNVTEEEFPVNVGNNFASSGYESYITNTPRIWGVRMKYRFGG